METRNTPVLREIIEVLSSEVDTMHFGWGWWGYLPIVTKKRRKRERIYTSVALVCLFCPTNATLRGVAAGRLVRAPQVMASVLHGIKQGTEPFLSDTAEHH